MLNVLKTQSLDKFAMNWKKNCLVNVLNSPRPSLWSEDLELEKAHNVPSLKNIFNSTTTPLETYSEPKLPLEVSWAKKSRKSRTKEASCHQICLWTF